MTPIMTMKPGVPIRRKRTVDISIDERPKRKTHIIANFRARKKFIDQIENIIRGSMEYKECVEFIKKKMNRSMCYVNPAIQSANGKKYTIDLFVTDKFKSIIEQNNITGLNLKKVYEI